MKSFVAATTLGVALAFSGAAFAQEKATAKMIDQAGKDMGTVTLQQTPSGYLHVMLELTGIPAGTHGFHIHEVGKCEGNFDSAKGHLTGGKKHGFLNPEGPHAGDFPNVTAAQNGVVKAEFVSDMLSLDAADGKTALKDADGSSVMVHMGPDDYSTDPAGDSGHRIACGVIQ